MEEDIRQKSDNRDNDIVFSKAIKAGKRIYYLDVKKNRKGELFLSITESKKISLGDPAQTTQFEKHKIFLYKEDFDKFTGGLEEVLDYIRDNNTVDFVPQYKKETDTSQSSLEGVEIVSPIEEIIDLKIDF